MNTSNLNLFEGLGIFCLACGLFAIFGGLMQTLANAVCDTDFFVDTPFYIAGVILIVIGIFVMLVGAKKVKSKHTFTLYLQEVDRPQK